MSKAVDTRLPNDIGKGQLPDHVAIKTPWEKLISLYDAMYFVARHRAGVGAVFFEVLRHYIPDYPTRAQRLAECSDAFYTYLFSPEPEGMGFAKVSADSMEVHPFMRGCFPTAMSGDNGDESLFMAGRVNDFGSFRFEKELDTCPWDILGSEICHTSPWAGTEGLGESWKKYSKNKGPNLRVTMVEALGCGDPHCRMIGENYDKYPMPPREKWDNFGPLAAPELVKYTPEDKSYCLRDCQIFREDCDFKYRNGTSSEYNAAGEGGNFMGGYELTSSSNLGCDYVTYVLNDMIAKGEVTRDEIRSLFELMFRGVGKMMFLDSFAIKGVRDWLGVPNEVNDGRVLGAYIEVYLQARKCAYDIVAFNKEEVVYDIDVARFEYGSQYMKDAYIPMWYGMSKTLVGSRWSLWEETEGAPEGKFRIKIAKKIDKFCL
jgi:hypothetical protein